MERGLREVDSHTVLVSLAEVLRVDVTDLTGDDARDPQASRYAAAREMERAVMAYDSLESVICAVHEPERLQTIISRDQSAALRHSQPRKVPLHILAFRHDDET